MSESSNTKNTKKKTETAHTHVPRRSPRLQAMVPVCDECGKQGCGTYRVQHCATCHNPTACEGCQCGLWLYEGVYYEEWPNCI